MVRSAAGKLNPDLYPVPLNPAAGDCSNTVGVGHITGGEDSGENTPNVPSNTVQSKTIQSIVALHEKFEFRRKITNRRSDNSNDNRRPNRDISTSWRDTCRQFTYSQRNVLPTRPASAPEAQATADQCLMK